MADGATHNTHQIHETIRVEKVSTREYVESSQSQSVKTMRASGILWDNFEAKMEIKTQMAADDFLSQVRD